MSKCVVIVIIFSLEGCAIEPTEEMLNVATIHYEVSENAEYGSEIELYVLDTN